MWTTLLIFLGFRCCPVVRDCITCGGSGQTHFGVCSECHHGKQSIGWTWRWRSDEPFEEDSR